MPSMEGDRAEGFFGEVRTEGSADRMDRLALGMLETLDPGELLTRLARGARILVDAERAVVWTGSGATARVAAVSGQAGVALGQSLGMGTDVWPSPLDAGEGVVRFGGPGREADSLASNSMGSLRSGTQEGLAAPLVAEDELLGGFFVEAREGEGFRESDVESVRRLAAFAAIGLRKARLYADVRALSLTDALTGLANRRHLEIHLAREFAAAKRGRPVSVVVFDIDDFKRYNDTFGHVAGDEALRAVGEVLLGMTRAMNLVARFGGDEFLSVLSGTPLEGARVHADQIQERLRIHPDLGPRKVSLSSGVAAYDRSIESPEALIRAADRDMYRSKSAGTG